MKTALSKNIGLILTLVGLLASLLGSAAFPTDARADALTWYVATTGDDANDCATLATPCATINGAIGKAANGDTIQVAVGTYTGTGTEVVLINKSITLSGGWDAAFTVLDGLSIIDGQGARRGITAKSAITAALNHFKIQNGYSTQGGGIDNAGSLTISDSIISSNKGGGRGIGIYNNGVMTITNTAISGNTSVENYPSSGGIENSAGTITLNNSTVSNNTFPSVYRGDVGGIVTYGGTLAVSNSTISGNDGQGIVIFNATVMLNTSTISKNELLGLDIDGGTTTLQNTIIAGNAAPAGDCYDNSIVPAVTSYGYNLIGNNRFCKFLPAAGDLIGTKANPIDPLLGPLQDNGGPTFTHALMGGSPALDAGNPAVPGSGGNACLATDQRGVARPVGSACDMGAFEGYITRVASIKRANPNPTSTSGVNFTITFSEAVTGVDTSAPFNDFTLTKTGVTGAAITAVTGSGATYTVSVNTGSGNGTIRLDVVDDDSLLDTSGNPLGGVGLGNGNFTTGEQYSVLKIPTPLAPGSTIVDTTPTYQWNKVPGATFYQYELAKSGAIVYTKTVAASTCGTTNCQSTPTTILTKGSYKWRVRAMIGGAWRGYSAYKSFTLAGPKAGFWQGSMPEFYVTTNQSNVAKFAIYVYGCDIKKIIHTPLIPIVNNRFSFDIGSFYAKGTFSSFEKASGTFGLKSYYVPGCGYLTGGPYSWTAIWKNTNQPTLTGADEIEPVIVVPLDAFPSDFIIIEPVNP